MERQQRVNIFKKRGRNREIKKKFRPFFAYSSSFVLGAPGAQWAEEAHQADLAKMAFKKILISNNNLIHN